VAGDGAIHGTDNVDFGGLTASDCNGHKCETLTFHDLGRRMLDLAARLIRQEDLDPLGQALPADKFRDARDQLIQSYASSFAH
jgi:hypothetical protein